MSSSSSISLSLSLSLWTRSAWMFYIIIQYIIVVSECYILGLRNLPNMYLYKCWSYTPLPEMCQHSYSVANTHAILVLPRSYVDLYPPLRTHHHHSTSSNVSIFLHYNPALPSNHMPHPLLYNYSHKREHFLPVTIKLPLMHMKPPSVMILNF